MLVSYWSIVAGDPAATEENGAALDFSNEIRMGDTSWRRWCRTSSVSGWALGAVALAAGIARCGAALAGAGG